MSLESSTEELLQRYNSLISKYVELAKELAPKLEKFGKYREELQFITTQFQERGFDPQISDGLIKMVEDELKNREIK